MTCASCLVYRILTAHRRSEGTGSWAADKPLVNRCRDLRGWGLVALVTLIEADAAMTRSVAAGDRG